MSIKSFKERFNLNARYKIVMMNYKGQTIYLIKKRTGMFSWEWLNDTVKVGLEEQELSYRAAYRTQAEAEERVAKEQVSDVENRVVLKVVKMAYDKTL